MHVPKTQDSAVGSARAARTAGTDCTIDVVCGTGADGDDEFDDAGRAFQITPSQEGGAILGQAAVCSELPESASEAKGDRCESQSPMAELRKLVTVPVPGPPVQDVLKLLFTAQRLLSEDRWGRLELSFDASVSLWLIRGEHFDEGFTSCRTELVVPLGVHDGLTLENHEILLPASGLEVVFYALVDEDGDVVLYSINPAPLFPLPGKRLLSDPAFVPRSVLAAHAAQDAAEVAAATDSAVAQDASNQNKQSKQGKPEKRRKKEDPG